MLLDSQSFTQYNKYYPVTQVGDVIETLFQDDLHLGNRQCNRATILTWNGYYGMSGHSCIVFTEHLGLNA